MKKLECVNEALFSSFEKDEVANLKQVHGGKSLNTCYDGCKDRWSTTNSEGRGDGDFWSGDACGAY